MYDNDDLERIVVNIWEKPETTWSLGGPMLRKQLDRHHLFTHLSPLETL